MPKSPLEIDIEKATNENVISEDWGLIMTIVDRINMSNGQKDALKIIIRRLNAKDPHIAMNTLTLLHACVVNCTRPFKLEVCTRDFIEELRQLIVKKRVPKISDKLAGYVQEWSNDKEFKNDPALSLMSTFYGELIRNGFEFKKDENKPIQKPTVSLDSRKEEEDLAKAIQLSLKETNAKQKNLNENKSNKIQTASLYGTLPQIQNNQTSTVFPEKRKVKALYDFEAAEENELTFKAGEILIILDDSDENWWKGSNFKTEGLFPSNFVTADLTAEIESFNSNENSKKVSFNDEVAVKTLPAKITIDEKKIDECLELIQNADPTGEVRPDSEEMLQLEDICYGMGPLIDQELQQIDQKHSMLEDLNLKLIEGFQLYHNLMKESISKQNQMIPQQQQGQSLMTQQNYSLNQNQLLQQQYMQAYSQQQQQQIYQQNNNQMNLQAPPPYNSMQPQMLGAPSLSNANPIDLQKQLSSQNFQNLNMMQQNPQASLQYQNYINSNNFPPNNTNDYTQIASLNQQQLNLQQNQAQLLNSQILK